MPEISTKKLTYSKAAIWKKSIIQASNASPVLYIFIGNHVPYANESSPDSIVDTVQSEKQVWNNMYAAKRATANDIELVVPRVNWTGNTKFRNYDDTIDASTLLSSNTSQNLKPMYIITSDRNVYKCMSNNSSANASLLLSIATTFSSSERAVMLA